MLKNINKDKSNSNDNRILIPGGGTRGAMLVEGRRGWGNIHPFTTSM